MQLVLLHTCQKSQPPKVHSKDGLTCNGRVLCRVDDGAVAADRNDKVAAFRQCGVIFAEREVFILPAVLFVHECFRTVFLQNRQNKGCFNDEGNASYDFDFGYEEEDQIFDEMESE